VALTDCCSFEFAIAFTLLCVYFALHLTETMMMMMMTDDDDDDD